MRFEGTVKAVDGVTFDMRRHRTVGVVGESGCGKSVTARSILQILDRGGRIVDGQILFHRTRRTDGDGSLTEVVDLARLHPRSKEIRAIRGSEIAMIFQEPMTYLFIAHDLSVVEHISNRVAVMYVGKVVEMAETVELYGNPQHPYTEALLSAVPKPDPRLRSKRIILRGEVADAANVPTGCTFHPRCNYAVDHCRVETPHLMEITPGHFVSCHRASELSLVGVPM